MKNTADNMRADTAAILSERINSITSFGFGGMEIVTMLLFAVFAIVAARSITACSVGMDNISNGYNDRGVKQASYAQAGMAAATVGFVATVIAYLML